MYEHRNFPENEEINIKCRITEIGLENYEAEGLCHENVIIETKDGDTDTDDLGLVKDEWYDVNGVVENREKESVVVKVSDKSDVENIGSKINDWIDHDTIRSINRQSSSQNPKTLRGKPTGSNKKQFRSMSMGSGSQQAANFQSNQSLTTDSIETSAAPEQDITGFATGGGKDIDNFRENIRKGYIPQKNALTYEGLFYDYEFDVSGDEKDSLFYPVYEHGVCSDLFSNNEEHYLTVGLESGIKSFTRPNLDLMIVLDISGSMGRSMDEYYYDDPNNDTGEAEQKIESAKEVISRIIKQLEDEDRFGVVLYNRDSWVSKPLRKVKYVDSEAIIEDGVQKIHEDGGTNLSAGFEKAIEEYDNANVDTEISDRESRVMFFTDAMPNMGRTDEQELIKMIDNASEDSIHTTFVGIGVDANQDLITSLSEIRGANHYFVNSTEEFKEQIAEEFSLITVPLVFNLKLQLEGENYTIADVYGNPGVDSNDESILETTTLFPSTGDEGTKGGVILIKLSDIKEDSDVRISATWEERGGTKGSDVRRVNISSKKPDYFESPSVRKAIALQKYAEELRKWAENNQSEDANELEKWERESTDKKVSKDQIERFEIVRDFLSSNFDQIDDEASEEIELLDQLVESN